MALIKGKIAKEQIKISLQTPPFVGYLDYVLRTPVTAQIHNRSAEALSLTLLFEGEEGILSPYETTVEIPYESTVSVEAKDLFSPRFLAENNELTHANIRLRVLLEGREVFSVEGRVNLLPYDYFEGLSGNPERLAAFVRPRLADCKRVLEEVGEKLVKWKENAEFLGYSGANKNAVRQTLAALFAVVKGYGVEKSEEITLSAPLSCAQESFFKSRKGNGLEIATYLCSCLEAARLHPVLAVGENCVGVGVWLYDSCFLDGVTDEIEIVQKYCADGINNLSFLEVDDLFLGKNATFTTSEGHFLQKLKEGYFTYFVDIHRLRISKIFPLPLRGRGLKGYELISDEELSEERGAPLPLPDYKKLSVEGKLPKNKVWERRLLDLSAKNALLHFNCKNALHLKCTQPDSLFSYLAEKESMKLKSGEEFEPFGQDIDNEKELILLEQKKGILRASAPNKGMGEVALKLFKRNKEAQEETGARVLYLAFGFLRYSDKTGDKYAPLVLAPVALKKGKGGEDFTLEMTEKEYFVNATLLEYLKQEFNIDVRGLGGDVSALKISEILGMVLAETAQMKGWTVVKDCYLAAFSFQRYLMWNDVRNHFTALSQNKTVDALLHNRVGEMERPQMREEDEGDPCDTLLPLPADSSQYSAIALSRTGASFVLYGPPGTGKSQTITNMIANALQDHKRVLFVAEKKAALDVVKKRLDFIGLGEFCLELHSNKTDKQDVLRRLDGTLSLAGSAEAHSLSLYAEEIMKLREELKAPMTALHQKRRLGLSVYQAILLYLQNKNAPDILNIESAFYDGLTEEKLSECKNMILSAAAAAKECGGVYRSPFDNVNESEYSLAFRDKVFCACEVILTEIKHLKSYLSLFLEFYRQKISSVTGKKLACIVRICNNFLQGVYDKYFSCVSEEQFSVFYNCNRRLDELLLFYSAHFKGLIDLSKDKEEIAKTLQSGVITRNKATLSAVKKLKKLSLHPLTEQDCAKFLQVSVDIYDAIERIDSIKRLSCHFFDKKGGINFKKRKEFLLDLNELGVLCAETFLDYNPDAFHSMCIRAQSGYTLPVLQGYLKAEEAFSLAQESFVFLTKGEKNKIEGEDILEYFSTKASSLMDNIDLLPNWCMYQKSGEKLKSLGCHFITEALEEGKLTSENILSGFEKNVYQNFLEMTISLDPELCKASVGTLEGTVEKFCKAWESCSLLSREKIRNDLIARLPLPEGEGSLNLELSTFKRLAKSNLRGMGLRGLFAEIPNLLKRACPCMLMSPVTVAQYLQPEADLFDLVIFDEASQMSTAEAVGSIARAKATIVVGDPKQLPPTSFFRSAYVDEDNLENEDLESVLDDCLALGMPERYLLWHYRSKHESLIAFSNSMYYDNKLCTFPSPDALNSKVNLRLVDGVYDRGFTKRNKKETEALVKEVVRRLSHPELRNKSMGIVTFSGAQQMDIEKTLSKELSAKKLDGVAYDREEPLFVKNLENVQGDERDVILFSVCYGPDNTGRVSLNFGPLNQSGGWRRLNVAVSRAREEMLVFSTMTADMIDLSKTSSKGVAGLKAFLEFAERGKTTLAVPSDRVKSGTGIGKFIAEELSAYGYECRQNVGASDCKIDVAVVNPKKKEEFILAVVCDASNQFTVKDTNVLQIPALERGGWNVLRVRCVNYYNNPTREIKRIKDTLDMLTGEREGGSALFSQNAKSYRAVKSSSAEVAAFITSGVNDNEIIARLKEIVSVEEPISRAFLKTRCMHTFGITKWGARVDGCLDALIEKCAFSKERACKREYFYKNEKCLLSGKFRVEKERALRKTEEDFTPFEMLSLIKCVLSERVSLYLDELVALLANALSMGKVTDKMTEFLQDCVEFGVQKGVLNRSLSDAVSLA